MADRRALLIESACHISVDTGRLMFKRADGVVRPELAADLSVLCLHHEQITVSHHALRLLTEAGCVVLVTNAQHMPCGVLVPSVEQASSVAPMRLRDQIALDSNNESKAMIWQTIVTQKISNSALTLRKLDGTGGLRLERLSREVEPGDPQNAEAQAAKHYWQQYFALPQFSGLEPGREKQGAADPVNARLNYGYAVLRAMVARELAVVGLNPILGVGHHSLSNAFNLADDLMEPFRSVVDWAVATLPDLEAPFVGKAKQTLLQRMEVEVVLNDDPKTRFRFASAITQMVSSYAAVAVQSQDHKGRVRLRLPADWRDTSM